MDAKWKTSKHPGVRYREHPTRRHGIGKDRYFAIRYQLGGKRQEEGLGWASQGCTEKKAAGLLAELRENQRRGEGPRTLREKRELAEAERRAMEEAEVQAKAEALTFGEVFTEKYLPYSKYANRNNLYEAPKPG